MPRPIEQVQQCELCGREVPAGMITLHHLTPRQKGGTYGGKSPLCRLCHKQLHATYSNTQLAREFATIAALRSAADLQPFLKWIRKQKPDRNFRTVQSGRHPHGPRRR